MLILSSILCIILILLFVCRYFTRNFSYWKKRGVPYAKPLPIVGNYLEVFTLRKMLGTKLAEIYREFEDAPFVGTFVLNTPQLLIKDPELIKLILVKDFEIFSEHALATPGFDPVFSNLLFLLKNPKWKALRAKNGPLFTPAKIRSALEPTEIVAETMINHLEKSDLNSLDVLNLSLRYVCGAIAACGYGVNAHVFDDEKFLFKKLASTPLNSHWKYIIYQHFHYLWPTIVHSFKLPFADPAGSEVLCKILCQIIEERKASNIKRKDVIDTVIEILEQRCEDDVHLDNDAIITQAIQYIAAGTETSTSTMTFALYELCINPDVQTKLRAELQRGLGNTDCYDYQTITELKYLDMVLSETLRKYPILPVIDRMCMKDYKIPNTNVKIEKDCPVFIPLLGLHYDPKYFPEPNAFKPERFSEENINSIPAFAYLPFGEGIRGCIGKRLGLIMLKVGLAQIISKYELEPSADTPISLKCESQHFMLVPEHAVRMKFKKIPA